MRNLPLICGLALVGFAMGADLPICEEFEGEKVQCIRTEDSAVITSMTEQGKSYEYYKNGKKAYLEVNKDRSLLASSGKRAMWIPKIPVDIEEDERYIGEVLEVILTDIGL